MLHISGIAITHFLNYATTVKLSIAKENGMNISQLLALVFVGSTGTQSIKDIRKKLAIPGSSTTFTIDSLEKKKLIKRQRSKTDRREWLISLTAKGERLYSQVIEAENSAISSNLENLSESDKESFLKLSQEIMHFGN